MPSEGKSSSGRLARKANDGSEALGRLRRGEMTLDAYLDLRADESVRPLIGLVEPTRLRVIRDVLREELTMDPVLVEMVRGATGRDPESGVAG